VGLDLLLSHLLYSQHEKLEEKIIPMDFVGYRSFDHKFHYFCKWWLAVCLIEGPKREQQHNQ